MSEGIYSYPVRVYDNYLGQASGRLKALAAIL
jgi:hypothetical protein